MTAKWEKKRVIQPKSLHGDFWAAKWLPGGLWAALGLRSFFWVNFGTHLGTLFGSKNRPKLCRNSVENRAPVLDAIFGQLEASWSRFGVDLESILGCFFAPQPTAFHQTAPKSSTTYFWRFRLLRGVQKTMKNMSGSSVRQEACSKSVLGGARARFGSIFSSILDPKIDPKAN